MMYKFRKYVLLRYMRDKITREKDIRTVESIPSNSIHILTYISRYGVNGNTFVYKFYIDSNNNMYRQMLYNNIYRTTTLVTID